jgi:hypothetical protein
MAGRYLDATIPIGRNLDDDELWLVYLRARYEQELDHGNKKQEGVDQQGQKCVSFHPRPWTEAFLTLCSSHVQF